MNALESLIELRDRNASVGWLELQSRDTRTESLQRLRDLFGRHGGNCPVRVRFETKQANLVLHLRDQSDVPVQVMPSETLCDEVEQLFGRPVLFFR